MHNKTKPLNEIVRAARLWPIWLRFGLQDIQMRYRRSAVGIGYIFLNLAVMVAALALIFSVILGQNLKTFLPFLTAGLIMWGYITASVVEGGSAFLSAEGYIKQMSLPLYVYVFRSFVRITATTLLTLPYGMFRGLFTQEVSWECGTILGFYEFGRIRNRAMKV